MTTKNECPLCNAGVKADRLVPVVINPRTPRERVVYIRQSLYDRIKAAAQSLQASHAPQDKA